MRKETLMNPQEALGPSPYFNKEKQRELHERLAKLEELGVKRKEYDLVPPFDGSRLVPVNTRDGIFIRPRIKGHRFW